MRIDVLVSEAKFIHELEQQKELGIFTIDDIKQSTGEALIICDQFLHYNELHVLGKQVNQICFYMLTNATNSQLLVQVKTICDSLGIHLLPNQLTIAQLIEKIKSTLFPDAEKSTSNVVTFISSLSNVGLTSTVLSVAHTIGKLTDAKIGVLGLNAWDDGVDQLSRYKGKYLNEIKTQLTNRLLDQESFLQLCHYEESAPFYYLAGNQNTKMERLFTVDEIDYLISLAKEAFDLVLVDAGSHWDNANMLQSLCHADLKMFVLNQQRKGIKKFEQTYQHILYPLGYYRSDFLFIMNGYIDDPSLPTEKDILADINIPFLTTIPHIAYIGPHSEVNQKLLVHYDVKEYKQAVNHISRGIMARTKVNVREILENSTQRKKWNLLARIGG